MATKATVNNDKTDVESIVNRWLVDYYFFRCLDSFKKGQYQDFCGLREILNGVLVRPVELTDVMPRKIRVLEFLAQINEGEKLDLSFESDSSVTPLESALMLLEKMNQEYSIRQQDFENAHASIAEMMVGIFIKNNKFSRAEEILNKHFPKPMVGKKAIFMGLINRKCKIHEVIKQMNFQRFREEMLAFCQGLFQFTVPFLYKAAEQLIDERHVKQDNRAAGTDERTKNGPSSNLQEFSVHIQCVPRKCSVIQRVRLEAAYKALGGATEKRTFAQLEEDVEREVQERENLDLPHPTNPKTGANLDSEQEGLFQRDSGSPMEASPADHPPQTDAAPETPAGSLSKTSSALWSGQRYTVHRLVVEPDSQVSSQCTADSQEQGTDVRAVTPPQTQARSNKKDLQCPIPDREVDAPVRKCPRRAKRAHCKASTSAAEQSADSEDNSLCSVGANGDTPAEKLHNQSNGSCRSNSKKAKQSSDSEEDPLELSASCRTPVQKPHKQLAGDPLSKDPDNIEDIIDSSLDSSPNVRPVPQTSSTPHKNSAQNNNRPSSKWKQLFREAQESKETWPDEESHFPSRKNSGSNQSTISNSGLKKMWTEVETQNLKDGVKKFGEGNWKQIKAYYSFKNRTNVNLKDRWRTMKNNNMV